MNEIPDFTELAHLQPKQKEAWYKLLEKNTKYELFGGSMAGGKSYLLRWSAVGILMYYWGKYKIPNIAVGLFSEDYPTLKDRQISKIDREFPEWLGEIKEDKIDGLSFQLRPKWGGGRILLRNLDDPSKYMSTEFAAEFMEESTRNKFQTFEDLRNRLRYPGVEEVKFLAASNPGGIGHGWNKKYFVDNNIPDDPEHERFCYIHANVYDNKYISATYIKQLESLPEQQRKAYLEGSWDVFEGQFYTIWDIKQHVINPFIPNPTQSIIVGGLDWGRVDNFSFHLSEISRVDIEGTHFFRSKVFLEVYGTEQTPKVWSEQIKEKMRVYNLNLNDITWIRADTQIWSKALDGHALDIFSQFVNEDERWRKLKEANKDRVGGWENLQNWLSLAPDGIPYLQFTSNCHNAIRLFPELVHDENKKEDVDQKGENDAADSVRYMHMGLKWIGGRVGAAKENQGDKRPETGFFVNKNDEGQEVLLNLNKFTR